MRPGRLPETPFRGRQCHAGWQVDSIQLIAADAIDNDCNDNGVPDECEADFDGDGLIDGCDPDIDDDGVLNAQDVCDHTPLGRTVDAQGRPLSDIDQDCDTDLEDFAHFEQGFTGPLADGG